MLAGSKGLNVSSCCSGPTQVRVEFDYLTVDGETCDRCGDTRDAVRAAVADARAALPASLAVLEFVERELTASRVDESNRVLVNGRPAEEWVGGTGVMSDCPSCSDLVGESVCCREIEVDGVHTEAVGRDVVFGAIMAAAGLEGSAARALEPTRPTSPCCAPSSAAVAITLVTGPGCG